MASVGFYLAVISCPYSWHNLQNFHLLDTLWHTFVWFVEYNSCAGALFCSKGGTSCFTLFMVPARLVFFASKLFANDSEVKKLSMVTFLPLQKEDLRHSLSMYNYGRSQCVAWSKMARVEWKDCFDSVDWYRVHTIVRFLIRMDQYNIMAHPVQHSQLVIT